jgi:drug/metabolite transporter (DMT)-like permease
MFGFNELLVFTSEIVLSSYPVLIKLANATVFAQIGFRMYVFAIAAFICALFTGQSLAGFAVSTSIAVGLLNILHVGASYTAFDILSAGNAMALFYTYPIMNLIGSSIVYDEIISPTTWIWMIIALIGALFVAQPSVTKGWNLIGVAAALTAAATETGIFLWFKNQPPDSQPWRNMFQMYGSSAGMWTAAMLTVPSATGVVTNISAITMVLFNLLVGFTGYAARFFAIPNISTAAFSSLSFFGIIAAYGFGWLFIGETPSMFSILGAIMIMIANIFLLRN